MIKNMTMRTCYYCNEPGTEKVIFGSSTYWFCPNHKQVVLQMIEEDEMRKRQQMATALMAAQPKK